MAQVTRWHKILIFQLVAQILVAKKFVRYARQIFAIKKKWTDDATRGRARLSIYEPINFSVEDDSET